jgi:hypothetical protein
MTIRFGPVLAGAALALVLAACGLPGGRSSVGAPDELLLLVVAFAPVDRVKALTAKVFELIG